MKRLALACVVLTACGGVALWWGWPQLVERLRVRLEHELSRAVGTATRIDELTVSVFPLSVHLGGISVGADPALVQVGSVDAQLFAVFEPAKRIKLVGYGHGLVERGVDPLFQKGSRPEADLAARVHQVFDEPGARRISSFWNSVLGEMRARK